MVNNYPEYAAGISYQKAEENEKHFYNAQVKVDPSDDSMSAVLTKDGEIISELPDGGGGGGSSDFSTAEVVFNGIGDPMGNVEIWAPILNSKLMNSSNLISLVDGGQYSIIVNDGVFYTEFADTIYIKGDETKTFNFVINSGEAVYYGMADTHPITVVSGAAEVVENVTFEGESFNVVKITGDCVLNIPVGK